MLTWKQFCESGQNLQEGTWYPLRDPRAEIIIDPVRLKIFKDAETGEYCVRFYPNKNSNKWDEGRSYYTNDGKDALMTMRQWEHPSFMAQPR